MKYLDFVSYDESKSGGLRFKLDFDSYLNEKCDAFRPIHHDHYLNRRLVAIVKFREELQEQSDKMFEYVEAFITEYGFEQDTMIPFREDGLLTELMVRGTFTDELLALLILKSTNSSIHWSDKSGSAWVRCLYFSEGN